MCFPGNRGWTLVRLCFCWWREPWACWTPGVSVSTCKEVSTERWSLFFFFFWCKHIYLSCKCTQGLCSASWLQGVLSADLSCYDPTHGWKRTVLHWHSCSRSSCYMKLGGASRKLMKNTPSEKICFSRFISSFVCFAAFIKLACIG